MTGHGGTHPWELLLVCVSSPLGVWLVQLLQQQQQQQWIVVVVQEALLVLFPMTLCQTNLLYPWGVLFLCLEFMVGVVLQSQRQRRRGEEEGPLHEESSTTTTTTTRSSNNNSHSRLPFVTCYRSSVLYLTFVAILAVDFRVFPRRFAKTEVSGYGLMDLGAGSFVVAAGLVARHRRPSFKAWTRRMVPLLILGGIRLATNKGLEYQEHVSEYGVHWNFFFTLACLVPLSSLLSCFTTTTTIMIQPLCLLGVYQWFLSQRGLQEWIQDAPRQCSNNHHNNDNDNDYKDWLCNIVVANREGILGCIGYLALFVAAQDMGRFCLWNNNDESVRGYRLFGCAGACWAGLAFLTTVLDIPVSRRSTNASFCVWTLAHNLLLLALLWAATRKKTCQVPPILNAVNQHGLLVFVVANLLTGLVNLSINTLEASDAVALTVVFGYLCVVGAFALLVASVLTTTKPKTD